MASSYGLDEDRLRSTGFRWLCEIGLVYIYHLNVCHYDQVE